MKPRPEKRRVNVNWRDETMGGSLEYYEPEEDETERARDGTENELEMELGGYEVDDFDEACERTFKRSTLHIMFGSSPRQGAIASSPSFHVDAVATDPQLPSRPHPQGHSQSQSQGQAQRVSSLDHPLSELALECQQLIDAALRMTNKRGQKKAVRAMARRSADILAECSLEVLFNIFCEPSVLKCEEGLRLVSHIVPRLGAATVWNILCVLLIETRLSREDLHNYGDVLCRACKNATKDAASLREFSTQLLYKLFDAALCVTDPLAARLLELLEPFALRRQLRGWNLDEVLYGCAQRTLLTTNLENMMIDSANTLRSLRMLIVLFPLASKDSDPITRREMIDKQAQWLKSCLAHKSLAVRIEAVKSLPILLTRYWQLLSRKYRAEVVTKILKTATRSSEAKLRLGLIEGLSQLSTAEEARRMVLKVVDHANDLLLEDHREKVRANYTQFLAKLQSIIVSHEFEEIIPPWRLFARLQVERSLKVQRRIVTILFTKYSLPLTDVHSARSYIFQLAEFGRVPVLRYCAHIAEAGLASTEDLLSHIRLLALVVASQLFKFERSEDRKERQRNDDYDSMDDDSNDLGNFEHASSLKKRCQKILQNSVAFTRHHLTLEVIVVLAKAVKKDLQARKLTAKQRDLDNILVALHKRLSEFYSDTCLVGVAMTLGCLLSEPTTAREVAQPAIEAIKTWDKQPLADAYRLKAYIELAAHGDCGALLHHINQEFSDALPRLVTLFGGGVSQISPIRKRCRFDSSLDANTSETEDIDEEQRVNDESRDEQADATWIEDTMNRILMTLHLLQMSLVSPSCQRALRTNLDILTQLDNIYKCLQPVNKLLVSLLHAQSRALFSLPRSSPFTAIQITEAIINAFKVRHTIALILHGYAQGLSFYPLIDLMSTWSDEIAWLHEYIVPMAQLGEDTNKDMTPSKTAKNLQIGEAKKFISKVVLTTMKDSIYIIQSYVRPEKQHEPTTEAERDADGAEAQSKATKIIAKSVSLLAIAIEHTFLPCEFIESSLTLAAEILKREMDLPPESTNVYFAFINFCPKWILVWVDILDLKNVSAAYSRLIRQVVEHEEFSLSTQMLGDIARHIFRRLLLRIAHQRFYDQLFASDEGPLECLAWDKAIHVLLLNGVFQCRNLFESFVELLSAYIEGRQWKSDEHLYERFTAAAVLLLFCATSKQCHQFRSKKIRSLLASAHNSLLAYVDNELIPSGEKEIEENKHNENEDRQDETERERTIRSRREVFRKTVELIRNAA